MKSRKMLTRIILIVAILFAIMLVTNQSHAVAIAAAGTLVAIYVSIAQWTCVAIGLAGQGIITGVTAGLGGQHSNVWSVKDVIFNRSTSTTAAYFADPNGFKMGLTELATRGPMVSICESVSNFYYIIRNLSIAVLLFVLLYIGIRMAISTVASEEAKYKKMLGNWAVSMALIFVLHYIMILTLYCNNILVEVLYKFVKGVNLDTAWLAIQGLVPFVGIGEAIVFMMLIGIELAFLFMYIKRIITLGFLIVIAPLITITYSIDKAGDGKSQALNTWLKEFIFTVLIQPFHCIIYIVLVQTVMEKMANIGESIGACVIYILMLKFMKEAEGIVKKIFGIQSDSMPGHSAMGALALGLFSQFGGKKGGKKGGSGEKSSKTMPNMRGEQTGRNRTGANTPDANPSTPNPSTPTPDANPPTPEPEPNPPTPDPDSNPPTPDPDANPPTPDSQDAQPGFFQRKIKSVDTALENKLGKKYKDYKRQLNGMKNRMGGSYWKKGAQYGAGLAALGLGLGMADEKAAIGAALVAQSGMESIQDAIDEHNNYIQLEDNEDVFKEKYANAVDDHMSRMSAAGTSITYEQAEDYINQQFDSMDKGTLTQEELSNNPILKELIEAREDMKDSYEVVGESPDAMVKRLSAQAMEEKKAADIKNGRTY